MTETYEQVRDSATGEAGAAWKSADRETARLTELYHKLKNDGRYTEQHRAEKAWQAYETKKDKIVGNRAKAKEHLHKQAHPGVLAYLSLKARVPLSLIPLSSLPPRTKPTASCASWIGWTRTARALSRRTGQRYSGKSTSVV
jgi:hypothetical protein